MVCTARRGPAAGHRRSSTTGRILDEDLGDLTDVIDANLGHATRLCHPGRPRARPRARQPLRARVHRRLRRPIADPRPRHAGRRTVTVADRSPSADASPAAAPRRRASPGSRTSSRPTTRRRTSRASSARRSRRCRPSPRRSRSSPSTTARRTGRRRSPTTWRRATRTSSGSSTTRRTTATARPCAPGSRPRRYELIAFTDGDRQFKVADIGRLTARLAEADRPDVVVGFRIKRADPLVRTALRPGLPAGQPALLRAPGHRRRLRLQALPARGARGHPRRVGRRVLLGGAAHQAARRRTKRRRGRRPALPTDGGLGDGRQAVGHPAGRARLLAAAAERLGRTGVAPSGEVARSSATEGRASAQPVRISPSGSRRPGPCRAS